MKEFTCIVCPNGCHLFYDEKTGKCTGNRCPRGATYAAKEATHPVRSLCTTVRTSVEGYPVIPVKTSVDVPKELIFPILQEIDKTIVSKPLPIHATVLKNVLDSGADIITTAPMEKENQ